MKNTSRISAEGIRQCVLEAGDVSVAILSLGCITHDWRVPLGATRVPVVQSFADPSAHRKNSTHFMGAIVGRVANRIGGARFSLDGQEVIVDANEGANQLHGGPGGISHQIWNMEPNGKNAVRLTHFSEDGAQGFPGAVKFSVTIRLEGHQLWYEMTAMPDRPTPVNLAQHSYYNLMGKGDIRDHTLHVAASQFTPLNDAMLPTGKVTPLAGAAFDFRNSQTIAKADPDRKGLDLNLVLNGDDGPAAQVVAPNGLQLRLWTDRPGLQVYTARHLRPSALALPGQRHGAFSGLCLEPQGFPDAMNNPSFPSILCSPERPYRQKLVVEIKGGRA